MKRSELVRRLSQVPGFPRPRPELEQLESPPEAAAEMLEAALAADDLAGRDVADLGCGTGRIAIGAALLGARSVVGVDADPAAVEVARRAARSLGVECRFVVGPVGEFRERVDTVLMNPPFGAQRRGADRPFWEAALGGARRAVYAFALADSRTFIARCAVERAARIQESRPVPWALPPTFPHHRKRRVEIPVDLWVLRKETSG